MLLGISERKNIVNSYEIKESNRSIFLKFWETYTSNRNAITCGYNKLGIERKCLLEREIIKDDRNLQIPHIYIKDERSVFLTPICFSERNCIYKKYWVEHNDKYTYLIPICCSERYTFLKILFIESSEKYNTFKSGANDTRYILAQLPPFLTTFDYKKCIAKYLPPHVSEKYIESPCFHVEYILPKPFQEFTDQCNEYTLSLINNDNEVCDKAVDNTVTSSVVDNDIIGLEEGFDYGELFILDLRNKEIFNLSLDSLFNIPIYKYDDFYTKDLYILSNKDNLLIRVELLLNSFECKTLFSNKWSEFLSSYEDEKEAEKQFLLWVSNYFINKNYISIHLMEHQLNLSWIFFKKFPRRFLVKFLIYIKQEYKNYIEGVKFIYYFPYQFIEPNKKRVNLLLFFEQKL